MFLPILNASLVANGKKMKGMLVEVWTSDNQRFLYEDHRGQALMSGTPSMTRSKAYVRVLLGCRPPRARVGPSARRRSLSKLAGPGACRSGRLPTPSRTRWVCGP